MKEDKVDEYKRIYGGCSKNPAVQAITEFYEKHKEAPWAPEWVRKTYPYYDPGVLAEHELHFEYLMFFNAMVASLRDEYDKLLGPRIDVEAPQGTELNYVIEAFDFTDRSSAGPIKLPGYLEWDDSAFARAALQYKRECHWDFAPGEAGIWISYIVLTGAVNECFSGNLAGFVILYDRDKDGKYETVAHIWTAELARRKGIARQLLARAKRDFPVERLEAPWTDSGSALIKAAWPEMVP